MAGCRCRIQGKDDHRFVRVDPADYCQTYCGTSCERCETINQRPSIFSNTLLTKLTVTREVPSFSLDSPVSRPTVQATFPLICTCVSVDFATICWTEAMKL